MKRLLISSIPYKYNVLLTDTAIIYENIKDVKAVVRLGLNRQDGCEVKLHNVIFKFK